MTWLGCVKPHRVAAHGHSELCVQGQLFAALRRTRLVEEGLGWQALQYSRCGRTDKGVSALGQARPLRRMLCECFSAALYCKLQTFHDKTVDLACVPRTRASF